MEILLTPPLAFLIYVPLVLIITGVGKYLAGSSNPSELKSSIYGSGEVGPTSASAPGYRPFFLITFFFAILHLGMLVLATGALAPVSGIFLLGLILCLVALVLG
jgi:NADH:ubiquinone oxidoreductase subunit 3 (subunit A)